MIDPIEFRQALGSYATGVTIITTVDQDGNKIGMTVSSFNSLSLDPPLILWSIDKSTGVFEEFTTCSHFAVHVLKEDQEQWSNHFAGKGFDKFKEVDSLPGLGGVPLLDHVCARFECSLENCFDGGDHIIIVGRVEKMAHEEARPLVFCQGRYQKLAE
ncbi:flavin reductase family protein [Temperatibacter marinus]|uniref:Flavin reductase family protein n=1 Tax=Temperatibacter marinus TaxID=1456591 RepID=A0AA52EIP1_9PROT|nr:flavin reductase family protein [Temperatibacter marinus]WND03520.1 flavin reductase family protein [Temperatibacter marinus]